MCVINVGGDDSVYMIFAGIEVNKSGEKWVPQNAERFIKLDGCRFFGSIKEKNRAWLHRVEIGGGAKGSMFMLAEGNNTGPGKIIGWSEKVKNVFREPLRKGGYGAVALVGIVYDMTRFLPVAGCKKVKGKKDSFCEMADQKLSGYNAERVDKSTYEKDTTEWGKFGDWVALNDDSASTVASTGSGWKMVRGAQKGEQLGDWGKDGFRKWMNYQLKQGGWVLPIGLKVGMAGSFQIKGHAKNSSEFSDEFRRQIAAGKKHAGSKYEWKKTLVKIKKD